MRMVGRLAGGIAALAIAVGVWPAAAHAEGGDGPGLSVRTGHPEYRNGDPVRLTFAVTNTSGAACGLSATAEGTVRVTSVRRDGQELVPTLSRSFYLDGIENAIRDGMTSAAPAGGVDVAVVGVRIDDGTDAGSVVLRSVAVMPGGSGLDTMWPVGVPGRYEVTASYAVPPVEGDVRPCAGATAARTVAFTVRGAGGPGDDPWLWVLIGGLVVLTAVVVMVVLLRRRRPTAAAVVLAVISLAGFVGVTGRPAHADYEVDPGSGVPVPGVDFEKAVAGCMAGFAAPGGDPAGLLNRLKDKNTPKVRIIPTTGGSGAFETPASKNGKGSSTVTWNPTSTDDYEPGVARNPCAALYHELSHSDDISRDSIPPGDCGDTGIKSAEVKATLAENRYRAAKGLKPRTEYQGKKLPKSMDECRKPKKKTPPPKGPVKLCEGAANQCGSTNGDPHLVTFDRAYYDFQAVGEFVVARSTSGDALAVQARQAPMDASRTVSVNSAVAFGLGTHRVELALAGGVTRVRLDGEPVELARAERKLPGGGTLLRRESDTGPADGYDLTWPDGSAAAVDQIGGYGYRLLLRLAAGRAGKVEGLLGDFDGDPADDIAPAGGAALTQPVPFEKLYPAYADSWRVRQSDSLFTYASGQGTDTFTDRSYPARAVSVADLDPARRAQAEAACRWAGVTDAWQFLECVFDVGVTGRPEFAVGSAATETVAPPAGAPVAAVPVAAGTLTAGGVDRLAFSGRAGQAVFVHVTGSTLPDECSPFRLRDPAGKDIGTGCGINGVGHIDRTELPVDGEYAVLLRPGEKAAGHATVRVYVAEDLDGVIAPNGAAVTATIAQPGSLARHRFPGTAGQRVFLDVPDSSLPDQCSPLQLRDAADKLVASGCVINGLGHIDGTVLPADGTYTLVVDPVNHGTGTVQMRLHASADRTATIAVNGPPVLATITRPGSVLGYEFTARAGTTVTVEATGGTLPDQCSPLRLREPGGKEISSGCVINGTGGIGRTVLPTTGTYTLVVDPGGAAIGSVTVSVRTAPGD